MSIYVGQQLQALVGDWDNDPTSFTYQWQDSADYDPDNPGAATWDDITGETRSDVIIALGEVGKYLRVQVVGTNAAGSSSVQNSGAVGPVLTITVLTGVWGIRG